MLAESFYDLFAALSAIGSIVTAYVGIYAIWLFIRTQRLQAKWKAIELISSERLSSVSHLGLGALCEQAVASLEKDDLKEYHRCRSQLAPMLSELELLALTIRKKLIDEEVAFEMLASTVVMGFHDAKNYIGHIRMRHSQPTAYSDFEALARRWEKRWSDYAPESF